jgi:peptidyl-prolyl cis-trans isomerase B (cyclophilin B)
MGNMRVLLYDETPLHRDNFVKLANEGYYDDLLFHRNIDGFMVQGGDPESKEASPGQTLGQGGPGYTIPAEIGAPHIKGALAAARLGGAANPNKESSGSQFYLVQGRPVPDAQLNSLEQQRNIKYNDAQRQLYKELGGTPGLDGDYTVFGEVVEGLDVIDKLAAVPTDGANRPKEDIRMKVYMD